MTGDRGPTEYRHTGWGGRHGWKFRPLMSEQTGLGRAAGLSQIPQMTHCGVMPLCSVSRGEPSVSDHGKGAFCRLILTSTALSLHLGPLLPRCETLGNSIHLSEPRCHICKLQSAMRICTESEARPLPLSRCPLNGSYYYYPQCHC